MPFPILYLPKVPFLQCYQFLDFKEVILLSQCSKSTRNLIQSIEKHKKDTWMDIYVKETSMALQLRSKKKEPSNPFEEDRRRFKWSLHTRRDPMTALMTKFVDLKIEGRIWIMSPSNTGWRLLTNYNEDYFLFWVHFLKDLFNCKIHRAQYENGYHFNFDKLFRQTDLLHQAEYIWLIDMKFSDTEVEVMMDSFEAKSFNLEGGVEDTFFYEKPIRFPRLLTSAWYSKDLGSFMSNLGKGESLNFMDPRISDEDTNVILKSWWASDNRQLAGITFSRYWEGRDFDIAKVTEGLPTMPGREKKRNATRHIMCQDNYQDGLDILREDGVLATILKHEDEGIGREISLIVWNDPNPNVE